MATFFLTSFFSIIALAVGVLIFIIGLFINEITIFESIAVGIVSGVLSNHFLHWHPAFSLLAGIGICILMLWVQSTRYGFWIIAIIMSLLWGFIFCLITYIFTEGDLIWTYVVFGLGSVITMLLHLKARPVTNGAN
ncbi:MAG: hypothetical protein FWD05_10030 [Oscillospiraceae bacterium]|nr:hypothetical protein [Oscillospiraceae bacterium]